ncbi:MAG: methyltransferase [Flavobacteriales bacterium]|nr:methyltransferase [Flavobacteriales bacterium]
MSDSTFHFKEFKVKQDRCAMKVGTDGVLLGAWTEIDSDVDSILDIGTGTGLIALQMAQRSTAQTIDALEIEPHAFEQAVENFENSQWADRLFCYHASLQEFVNEIDEKYDLIISNPPYFNDTFKDLDKQRALARHTQELSFNDLLDGVSKLLTNEGKAALIIPFKEEANFLELAKIRNLFPLRISRYRGNENSDLKRSLVELKNEFTTLTSEAFFLEHSRHEYSEYYKNLVKDFYLKL